MFTNLFLLFLSAKHKVANTTNNIFHYLLSVYSGYIVFKVIKSIDLNEIAVIMTCIILSAVLLRIRRN